MIQQESRKHHSVPRFLLKPWAIDDVMNGYWWDSQYGHLACKRRGTRAFCSEIDLLTLERHDEGRDILENKFFGAIDTKGAVARDRLLRDGPEDLDEEGRCDFARLLLSLEARRPSVVRTLRDEGSRHLAKAIDSDPEILREMKSGGLSGEPSTYVAQHGISFKDRALASIQKLVDNPRVGGKLINSHWRVVRLGPHDGTLVLADRPLVRLNGYDHPEAAWFLPLDPYSRILRGELRRRP